VGRGNASVNKKRRLINAAEQLIKMPPSASLLDDGLTIRSAHRAVFLRFNQGRANNGPA
jgi:hypothetical protein